MREHIHPVAHPPLGGSRQSDAERMVQVVQLTSVHVQIHEVRRALHADHREAIITT